MKKFVVEIEGYSPYMDDYIWDSEIVEAETEEEAKEKRLDFFCTEYDLVIADCEVKNVIELWS